MSKCFFTKGTQVWENRDLTGIKEAVLPSDGYLPAEEIGNGVCRIYDAKGTIGYAKKSPDKGAKPWYQVFGEGTFKGAGLGVEFKKLPVWLRYLLYGAIALAIAYVYKKLKK
jgi:hypothetical protein